ncbi:MAG: leucine-rich repeat protein [Lachnospiraceae bacterium]|nr:leucine-rich repeat protein [Lachnospiraceae bacterium]
MEKKYVRKKRYAGKVLLSILMSVSTAISGVAAAPAPVSQAAGETGKVHWVMSQNGTYMQDMGELETTAWDDNNHSELYIDVDENITYQQMAQDIWGGCFNERSWDKLMKLTETDRNHILDLLFDPNEPEGMHLTMGRVPIGSSDFAMDHYSLNETADDYEMKNFSIDRDKEMLIPYIKEALKRQPNLKIWASPWSPPTWMKKEGENDNTAHNNLIGGWFDSTEENMRAYALYFRKFIEAYRAEGIDIYMVSPQNEPTIWSGYASCRWSGEQLRDFIKGYLGPEMKKMGVEIYLGTLTNSDDSRVDPTLNDAEAKKYISGVGFQWWSYNKARSMYHTGFNMGMMQTETMCGNGNNDWQYAENQFDIMYMYFSYGITSYNMWNLVLEWDGTKPGGYNTANPPWPQNAPVTVNETTKEYLLNPQYYEIKHFTDAVKAGARRIESSGTYDQAYAPGQGSDAEADSAYTAQRREIAFRNADGTISLLVKNGSSQTQNVDINFNGRKVSAELPAHSISTFTTQGTPLTGNETDRRETVPRDKIVSIKNAGNGQSLCVNGGGTASLSNVISWDYSGQANQQWYLKPSKVGEQNTIKLVNMKSFSLAAINGGTSNDGERLIIWPDTGEVNQNWIVEEHGEYVKFKHAENGLYLSLEGSGGGVKAVQKAASDSELQLWQLENAYTEEESEPEPEILSVSITPQMASIQAGKTQQFMVKVTVTNNAPQMVVWSVSGNKSSSTKISPAGLLQVGADETSSALTVKAESALDKSKYAQAAVTVTKAGTDIPKGNTVPKKNAVYKVGKLNYKVSKSSAENGTVEVKGPVKKTDTTVTIPATVKINGYIFKVTSIGKKAFYGCKKLKKVTIGDNVTKIGASAFASNQKLAAVTIGKGVTFIDVKAFYKNSELKNVKIKSSKVKTVKKQAFTGISRKAKISVPKKSVKKYKKLLKKAGLSSAVQVR